MLASHDVELELVVLDDQSTDRTPAILAGIDDPRLRVASRAALPAGLVRQAARLRAARRALARHDLMVFVDADVRLAPDALARDGGLHAAQRRRARQRLSAPDRRGAGPSSCCCRSSISCCSATCRCSRMRRDLAPALGAGCGQLFVARRDAYARAGGHARDPRLAA